MDTQTRIYLEELQSLLDDIFRANVHNISIAYTRVQVADFAFRVGNDLNAILNSDKSDSYIFQTLQSVDDLK